MIPAIAQNYSLNLEVVPPVLPADGGEYPIYITLMGPDGALARAPADIAVKLFASPPEPRVVELPSEVVIKKGELYAKAYLRTSRLTGQAIITAAADGLRSGETTVRVVPPVGQPVKLAVYVRPSTILPYPDEIATVIVRLEDALGHPVEAPEDVRVRLTLSNADLGELAETAVIPKGEYQRELQFKPKGLTGALLITASAIGYERGVANLEIRAPRPASLKLYAAPTSIPADSASYGFIAVMLVDSEGYPVRAEEDVAVSLSSSNDMVIALEANGTVIRRGEYYSIVRFLSKSAAGTSRITAHAEGLLPDSVEVSAAKLGRFTRPNKVNLYVVPSVFLPDGSIHKGSIVLQLVDGAGSPIKMWQNVTFVLSSSDTRSGDVTRLITVPAGSNIGVGDFYAGRVPGRTKLTATSDGFEPGYFDVEVKGRPPTSLKLEMAPPTIKADGREYKAFVVQLLDSSGNPARAASDITVYLLPSDATLLNLPSKVVVPSGRSFVEFSATTTDSPGELKLFAHSHGLEPATLSVNVEEPYPRDLKIAIEPPYAPACSEDAELILWVESSGVPAKLSKPINVSLFTTNSTVAIPESSVVHRQGNVCTISKLKVGEGEGMAYILAISTGFNPCRIPFHTVLLPMSVEFNTSAKFIVGRPSPISLRVRYLDLGIPNAEVSFEAVNGTVIADSHFTDSDGWLTFNYVPRAYGKNVISVKVKAKGHLDEHASFEVMATAHPNLTISLIGPDGMPISGLKVGLVAPNGAELAEVTDERGKVVFKGLEVGDYKVVVPKEHLASEKERLTFSAWLDGRAENPLAIKLMNDTELVANYARDYLVLVNSQYGTVKGAGWYREGSIATISISPEVVQLSPLVPPQRFVSWAGDVYSTAPATSFVVDSPKVIVAQWAPDYIVFMANISPIMAVVAILAIILLLMSRRMKRLKEEAAEELF